VTSGRARPRRRGAGSRRSRGGPSEARGAGAAPDGPEPALVAAPARAG